MKRIIVGLVITVFFSSQALAFDPSELKGLTESLFKEIKNKNTKSNETESQKTLEIQQEKKTVKQPLTTADNFCKKIETNEYVNKYIDLAERARSLNIDQGFDTKDDSIYKWVFQKFLEVDKKQPREIDSYSINEKLNTCAQQAKDSKYLSIYADRASQYIYVKNKLSSRSNLDMKKYEDLVIKPMNTAASSNLYDNGNYYPSAAAALFFDGGEDILKSAALIVFPDLETNINQAAAISEKKTSEALAKEEEKKRLREKYLK